MPVEGIFAALRTTLSGLSTQMKRMNVISENISNAEKAPDENGKVYQRKVLLPKSEKTRKPKSFSDEMSLSMRRTEDYHVKSKPLSDTRKAGNANPESFEVKEQKGEMLVYNPSHPRADENGYVRMPNVNLVEEMVDLVSASRNYEANVSVITAAKQMAKRTLEL